MAKGKKRKEREKSEEVQSQSKRAKTEEVEEVAEGAADGEGKSAWESLSRTQRRNKIKKDKLKKKKLESAVSENKVDNKVEDMKVPVTGEEREEEAIDQVQYPYTVDPSDHCETPAEAYRHICPILDCIVASSGKSRATLRIYDPYYCEGSVISHLVSFGFDSVINRKRDFYADIESGDLPDYDVLVTNPPYSGDHVPKLLTFACLSKKPFLLLMPNYFYMKDYFHLCLTPPPQKVDLSFAVAQANAALSSESFSKLSAKKKLSLFFVSPLKRYGYFTPKGRRQAKSAKYTAPFPSFWYCYLGRSGGWESGGDANNKDEAAAAAALNQLQEKYNAYSDVLFSRNLTNLPLAVRPESDPLKKAERNDRKREKHKARKLAKLKGN